MYELVHWMSLLLLSDLVYLSLQGILYQEYSDAKKLWENDRNKLLQQKTEAEEAVHQLEAKSTHLLVA